MRLEDFDYELPESLIAQQALPDRAASRLMVVDRKPLRDEPEPRVTHAIFRDLPRFLNADDVLVVNRSRVIPARLFLHRKSGARVELLFVRSRANEEFEAWVKPMGRLRVDEVLRSDRPGIGFRFLGKASDREGRFRLETESTAANAMDAFHGLHPDIEGVLEAMGHVPLPPYIRRPDQPADRDRYQTVYAREKGSVAAPTAGLHFDQELLRLLSDRGVAVLPLVLHVGPGTFSPLEAAEVGANRLEPEQFRIPAETIAAIRQARGAGKRIVAVGTTVTRALEAADDLGWFGDEPAASVGVRDLAAETDLFIYPGYRFGVVDAMITNFHLPRSSLLLLVGAFLGRERTLACYRKAVEKEYRFYSYGDAMLIR
jgi:S-adenosylmethionine:tRNA ribosyltransferase-isomerase